MDRARATRGSSRRGPLGHGHARSGAGRHRGLRGGRGRAAGPADLRAARPRDDRARGRARRRRSRLVVASSDDPAEARQRPHPEPWPAPRRGRLDGTERAGVGRGVAASPASSSRPSRSRAAIRLTRSRVGWRGSGAADELARPRRPTPIGAGIDQQPVTRRERRLHARSRHGHARPPRTPEVHEARRQGRPDGGDHEAGPEAGEEAVQEGRPPLVAQKMSAMAATCDSSSAAAAALTDLLARAGPA